MALRTSTQRRTLRGLGNGVLLLMFLWTAIPFYWMVATSLKHDPEIYGYEATLIPERPTLDNYATVFRETPYLLYLRNSVAVAVGSTVLSMVIAVLGAYAIARLDFPGRALLARGLVFTYLVPTSLLFIPMFAMMSVLRLTDSLHGLIIANIGMKSSEVGTRYVNTRPRASKARPGKLSRAIAYAARHAITMDRMVEPVATARLLRRKSR